MPKRRASILRRIMPCHLVACTLLLGVCVAHASKTTPEEFCKRLQELRTRRDELQPKVTELEGKLRGLDQQVKNDEEKPLPSLKPKEEAVARIKKDLDSAKIVLKGWKIGSYLPDAERAVSSTNETYATEEQKVEAAKNKLKKIRDDLARIRKQAPAEIAAFKAAKKALTQIEHRAHDFFENDPDESSLSGLERALEADPNLSSGCPNIRRPSSTLTRLCSQLEGQSQERASALYEIRNWASKARGLMRQLADRHQDYAEAATNLSQAGGSKLEKLERDEQEAKRKLLVLEKELTTARSLHEAAVSTLEDYEAKKKAANDRVVDLTVASALAEADLKPAKDEKERRDQTRRDRDTTEAELKTKREELERTKSELEKYEERANAVRGKISARIDRGKNLKRQALGHAAAGRVNQCKEDRKASFAALRYAQHFGRSCLVVDRIAEVPELISVVRGIDCQTLIRKGQLVPDRDRPGRESGGLFPKGNTGPTEAGETTEVATNPEPETEADGAIGEATGDVEDGVIPVSGGLFPRGITGPTEEDKTAEVAMTPEEVTEAADAIGEATGAVRDGVTTIWGPDGTAVAILGEDEEEECEAEGECNPCDDRGADHPHGPDGQDLSGVPDDGTAEPDSGDEEPAPDSDDETADPSGDESTDESAAGSGTVVSSLDGMDRHGPFERSLPIPWLPGEPVPCVLSFA